MTSLRYNKFLGVVLVDTFKMLVTIFAHWQQGWTLLMPLPLCWYHSFSQAMNNFRLSTFLFSDKKNVTAVAAAADPNLRHIVGHHVDVVSVTHVQRAEDDVGGQPGHLILTPNTHIHTTWNLLVVFIFIYFVRSIFLFSFLLFFLSFLFSFFFFSCSVFHCYQKLINLNENFNFLAKSYSLIHDFFFVGFLSWKI